MNVDLFDPAVITRVQLTAILAKFDRAIRHKAWPMNNGLPAAFGDAERVAAFRVDVPGTIREAAAFAEAGAIVHAGITSKVRELRRTGRLAAEHAEDVAHNAYVRLCKKARNGDPITSLWHAAGYSVRTELKEYRRTVLDRLPEGSTSNVTADGDDDAQACISQDDSITGQEDVLDAYPVFCPGGFPTPQQVLLHKENRRAATARLKAYREQWHTFPNRERTIIARQILKLIGYPQSTWPPLMPAGTSRENKRALDAAKQNARRLHAKARRVLAALSSEA